MKPPAAWDRKDRRRHPRFRCQGNINLMQTGTDVETRASVSDISRNGCYVDTMSPLPADTSLHVSLALLGEVIEAEMTVRASHPALGMGLEFTRLDEKNQALLDKVLAQLKGGGKPVPTKAQAQPTSPVSLVNQEASVVLEALLQVLEAKGVLSRKEVLQALEKRAGRRSSKQPVT
ncbi:MAG: PilZ domain-containing protein [Acidobacteriota bacterium]